jgi:hypothetical protein
LATSKSQIVLGVDPQTLRPQDEAKWPQLAELIGMPESELRRIFTTKTRSPNVSAPAAGREDAGPSLFDFSLTDDTPKSETEQDVIADETLTSAASAPSAGPNFPTTWTNPRTRKSRRSGSRVSMGRVCTGVFIRKTSWLRM